MSDFAHLYRFSILYYCVVCEWNQWLHCIRYTTWSHLSRKC